MRLAWSAHSFTEHTATTDLHGVLKHNNVFNWGYIWVTNNNESMGQYNTQH